MNTPAENLLALTQSDRDRYRDALSTLARACHVTADARFPEAVLLTAGDDLDWDHTGIFIQSVLEGSTATQALDDLRQAITPQPTQETPQ